MTDKNIDDRPKQNHTVEKHLRDEIMLWVYLHGDHWVNKIRHIKNI